MEGIRGHPKILQFSINEAAIEHGRLNPHIPLERAGDCTANTLFTLDVISREIGIDLSYIQTKCKHFASHGFNHGMESRPNFLFSKYLFQSISKQYNILKSDDIQEVLQILDELKPGQGTFLAMNHKDALGNIQDGHAVTVHRNREGDLEIIDLQNNLFIPFMEFANYFQSNNYNTFTLPASNLKRDIENDAAEPKRSRASVDGGKRKTHRKRTRKTRNLKFNTRIRK